MKNKRLLPFIVVTVLMFLLVMSACQPATDSRPEESGSTQSTQAEPLVVQAPITQSATAEDTVIGSYTSEILDTDKNRVNNIVLAVGEINGKVVAPGKVFSFNRTVGRRTAEDGYKKARIILRGKKSWGRGGGVCQVSSTLYNAVLAGGLKIVERHHHSRRISYVPEGKDATVVYGVKDFKFKNNRPYPVKITGKVEDGKVTIEITEIRYGEYGTGAEEPVSWPLPHVFYYDIEFCYAIMFAIIWIYLVIPLIENERVE